MALCTGSANTSAKVRQCASTVATTKIDRKRVCGAGRTLSCHRKDTFQRQAFTGAKSMVIPPCSQKKWISSDPGLNFPRGALALSTGARGSGPRWACVCCSQGLFPKLVLHSDPSWGAQVALLKCSSVVCKAHIETCS